MSICPLVEELSPAPDPAAALRALSDCPGVLLLESALKRGRLGQHTFLTADPFERFELPAAVFGQNPFNALESGWSRFRAETVADLPPFQGGAAGLLSYELGSSWERLTRPGHDEFQLPALSVGLYDWVIAWDHRADRAWLISQGFPETTPSRRNDLAARRIAWVRERLRSGTTAARFQTSRLPAEGLAPRWIAPGPEGLLSNFSRDSYLRAVERVVQYIHAGDIFQSNLSQRLLYPLAEHPVDLYSRLRLCNPAPFAGYFANGDWAVASASPERFVAVSEGEVETRPIKGTRQRRTGPEADLFTRDELRESTKDQAENVMIVDLMRNDLSRVCRPGTIRVPSLCSVETYETVQHLVSEIRGTLEAGKSCWDLLRAVFPGGSVTGAPKVRAMEVIAELEPTVRGPYCGSLFYLGFDGRMDSSILIRTFVCRRGWIQCCVGGGIVAQSDPAAEYQETLHKAAGMLKAVRQASRT